MSEADKAIVRRIPLEAINEGRIEVVDEVFSKDLVDHAPLPAGLPPGREGLKAFIPAIRTAFPDIRYTVEREVVEGDTVVQHVSATGTMTGELAGMAPTGRSASWEEVHIARMQGGKVVEHWGVVDAFGMFQQLGLLPGSGEIRAA
jgi:predicted ester cyclase